MFDPQRNRVLSRKLANDPDGNVNTLAPYKGQIKGIVAGSPSGLVGEKLTSGVGETLTGIGKFKDIITALGVK